MSKIAHYVVGQPASGASIPEHRSPLQIYLPTLPAGIAATYIEATTHPGDLILDPFCQTPQIIREGLALGRRVLAANFNPVAARAVDLALPWQGWPDQDAINIAFTHLVETPAAGAHDTLPARLAAHYATRCPTCHKPAQADSFVWDRDKGEPIEKHVYCAVCDAPSRGAVDPEDLALAKRYEPRSLPYWLLLNRAAVPEQTDEHERAGAVLAAYTPRALAAISDVLTRFDALPEAEQAHLRPLLLETLAVCSAIHPASDDQPETHADKAARPIKPRSLKTPQRFVERNVWRVLASSLNRAMDKSAAAQAAPSEPAITLPRAADLNALLAQREPAACVISRSSREIARLVEPGRVALIIGMPPDLDPTFWALSAVWSAWLWGARAAEALRPLLGRRRADVEWLWRGLASALGTLAGTLAETGAVTLIHPAAQQAASSTTNDDWVGGLALAGAGAGLKLEHLLAMPREGLRVMWTRGPAARERQLDTEALGVEVMEVAEHTTMNVIRARGEPVTWTQLAANTYQALANTDLLHVVARMPDSAPPPLTLLTHFVQGTFEGRETALRRMEGSDQIWWVNRPMGPIEPPLSDRVEQDVYEMLQAAEWEEAILIDSLYRRFPGMLTPERELVELCLESYARRTRAGVHILREEEHPEARRRDVELLYIHLGTLGKQMGYEIKPYAPNRLVWVEKYTPVYTFSFSATAQLAPHLLIKRPPPGVPVLVTPGERVALIEYKLRRNVQFCDAVAGAGWQFLQFCAPAPGERERHHLASASPHPNVSDTTLPRFQLGVFKPGGAGGLGHKNLERIAALFSAGDAPGQFTQPDLGIL